MTDDQMNAFQTGLHASFVMIDFKQGLNNMTAFIMQTIFQWLQMKNLMRLDYQTTLYECIHS